GLAPPARDLRRCRPQLRAQLLGRRQPGGRAGCLAAHSGLLQDLSAVDRGWGLAWAQHWHNMPIPSRSEAMPTRNVVLTDHQAELIEKLVESGFYQTASEVLREGLRLLKTRAAEDRARLKALRQAIQVGIDDLESGRYRQFSSFADLDKYLSE